jgi:hypothetical protein
MYGIAFEDLLKKTSNIVSRHQGSSEEELTLRSVESLWRDLSNPLIQTGLCAGDKPGGPLGKAIIVPPRQERVSEEWMDVCGIKQACSSDIVGHVALESCGGFHAEPRGFWSSLWPLLVNGISGVWKIEVPLEHK